MIAKFIGQDGSLGFRTGRKYIINIERDNNNNWIWVKELFGRSCPYQSMNTLKKNWDIPSNKFHPARQYRQLFVFRFSKCIWRFFGRGQIIFTKSKNFFPEIYPGYFLQYVRFLQTSFKSKTNRQPQHNKELREIV